MSSLLSNLHRSEIELRDRLNGLECEWIVDRLRSAHGVESARCIRARPERLVVEYDADKITTQELLDILQVCGLRAGLSQLRIRGGV